jgi:hypothetical protein
MKERNNLICCANTLYPSGVLADTEAKEQLDLQRGVVVHAWRDFWAACKENARLWCHRWPVADRMTGMVLHVFFNVKPHVFPAPPSFNPPLLLKLYF